MKCLAPAGRWSNLAGVESNRFKRRVGCIGAVALAVLLGIFWLSPREPEYMGRPVREYVRNVISTNRDSAAKRELLRAIEPEAAVHGLIDILNERQGLSYKVRDFVRTHFWKQAPPPPGTFILNFQNEIYSATYLLGDYRWMARPAVPSLVRQLNETNLYFGIQTILTLEKIGAQADRAIPRLVRLLTSTNVEIQIRAANALGAIDPDDPGVVAGLLPLITGGSSSALRQAAAKNLQRAARQPPDLAPLLWKCAEADELWVGPLLVQANAQAETNLTFCLEQLRSSDLTRRRRAAFVLGATRPVQEKIKVALLGARNDPDEKVAKAVALACEWVTEPNRLGPDLWKLLAALESLKYPADTSRFGAMKTFTLIGPSARTASSAILTNLYMHPNFRVRAQAASALGAIGDPSPEIIQALQKAAVDEWGTVRDAAAQALEALQQPTEPIATSP